MTAVATRISFTEAVEQFHAAMSEKGIVTQDNVEADGKIHRFHVEGDRRGSKNGWYILYVDEHPAGAFGCAKRHGIDVKFSWSAKRPAKPLTREERNAYRERMDHRRSEKAEAERVRHAAAAELAQAVWDAALPVVGTESHPYLASKKVKPHGLRIGRWEVINPETGEVRLITDNALLVPITDRTRKIHNLQAIFPKKLMSGGTRDKDFLKDGAKLGFFHAIGKPQERDGRKVFVIVEGYATGASVHECTGHCVLVTFDTSNLMPVAKSLRECRPDAIILIAADNDQWVTEPVANPGVIYAKRAAAAIGGLVAVPQFASLEGRPTDFNDLHQREGYTIVSAMIEVALEGKPTNEPVPATQALAPAEHAAQGAVGGRDEERRRQQQEENERLQETEFGVMFPSKMTVAEMLSDLVWIAEGEQVAHVSPNRTMFLSFKEMRSLTAESTTYGPGESMKRPMPNAVLWQRNALRRNAMTRTFHAGAGIICADPDGKMAVNTWRPMRRWEAKADISLFLDHVAYLFADEAERNTFLDWLAHLEQKSGELPHYGWLHVAHHTGCGRNWFASLLSRVWRGYVAPNVDLPALLDSPYNGSLSGRVIAIVDEIQEGGGESNYRHTNKLRSLVNAEYRDVNPKYGRQYREHNSCRWLVFSNHLNALPIDSTDRRWRVVVHSDTPRASETYVQLYAALNDPEFINAVAVFLQKRDISQFKPGERPPMSEAKRAVVGASKTMLQQRAEELIAHWPSAVISNADVANVLTDGESCDFKPVMRRSLEGLGAVSREGQIKIGGRAQRVWFVRNVDYWSEQDNEAIKTEFAKARSHNNDQQSATSILADAGEASRHDSDMPI